jgi:hypothetical protein
VVRQLDGFCAVVVDVLGGFAGEGLHLGQGYHLVADWVQIAVGSFLFRRIKHFVEKLVGHNSLIREILTRLFLADMLL